MQNPETFLKIEYRNNRSKPYFWEEPSGAILKSVTE